MLLVTVNSPWRDQPLIDGEKMMTKIFELNQDTPELTIRQMLEVYLNEQAHDVKGDAFEKLRNDLYHLMCDLNICADLYMDEENKIFLEEQKKSSQKDFCDLFPPDAFIDQLMTYLYQYYGRTVPTTIPQFYSKRSELLTSLIQWMNKQKIIHIYSMKYLIQEIQKWSTSMLETIDCAQRLNEYFFRNLSDDELQQLSAAEGIFIIESIFIDTLILQDSKQHSYHIRLPILIIERMKKFIGQEISARLEKDPLLQDPYYRFLIVGRIFPPIPEGSST